MNFATISTIMSSIIARNADINSWNFSILSSLETILLIFFSLKLFIKNFANFFKVYQKLIIIE